MEDGLRGKLYSFMCLTKRSLNPCSCGGWSQSLERDGDDDIYRADVLILVLVEDGLREYDHLYAVVMLDTGLNPCSCGGWSQSFMVFQLTNGEKS